MRTYRACSASVRIEEQFVFGAFRTPFDWLPTGAPKEEFGRMIFQKKYSLGDRILKLLMNCTEFRRSFNLLVEVRRGAGTCDAPCILDPHCGSASF